MDFRGLGCFRNETVVGNGGLLAEKSLAVSCEMRERYRTTENKQTWEN